MRGGRSTRLFICCRIGTPRCLFLLSDFAKQKTKVTQEFFENDEGVPPSPKAMAGQGRGRRKEPYKKAGGTPKGFFFSPCNQSAIFYNTANIFFIFLLFALDLLLLREYIRSKQYEFYKKGVFL